MRKKGVFCILVLILVTLVYAAPNAIITLTPTSLYETNEADFNLTINNFFGNEVIENIDIIMPSFTITSVVDFFGWQNTFAGNQVTWFDGDIETNAVSLFQFSAVADVVTDDTIVDTEIITDDETIDIIEVTILNDNTPPVLSNNIPEDGGFLRAEINNQLVSVDAEDPETGIKEVSFSYWDCSVNATPINIILNCVDGTCTTTVDLSEYQEGEEMCFEFAAVNNALDTTTLSGTVGFDGTAPSVYLIAPDDNSYGSSNTLFSFNATDNLAPTLTCDLVIDGEVIDSAVANNGAITETTYDMSSVPEGNHEWKVTCTDWVDLSADSETRNIIIDTTAPVITLVSPENNSIIGDNVMIEIEVTDNYEVDTVEYSISLNSSDLDEGLNVLVVTATDKAGNVAIAEFVFTVDRTAPIIDLISPEDNGSSDVHVAFIFDTDDNLDDTLDCTIYLDGAPHTTEEVSTDETANITIIIPMDEYEWYITCEDDAGNEVTTETRDLTVTDLTGPDIVSDIIYVARTEDFPFDVEITDPSGVDDVEIVFDSDGLDITNDGDLYSGVIVTDLSYDLGAYDLTITADDTLDNENIFVDGFMLIQGYIITLTLSPATSEVGGEVIASGTVTLDDGEAVPEDFITLYIPNGPVNVTIVNGSYTYTFNAPTAGTYTIKAVVVSSEGFEHDTETDLTVNTPASGGGSGGPSVGTSYRCGDGSCQSTESCSSCASDCGKCPVDSSSGDSDGSNGRDVGGVNLTQEDAEEPREPAGVGKASGLFARTIGNKWIWLVLLLTLTGLYLMSTKKNEKINWKGYFDK